MKHLIISFVGIVLLIAILWFTIGGQLLAISLGAIFLVFVTFAAFALGSWWSARLMREGANIALVAQTSDDKRDLSQMNALSGLVKETLKIGNQQGNGAHPQYPALVDNNRDTFTITGLPDDK